MIPEGCGTPVEEVTQVLEQFALISGSTHVYYVPIVKSYKQYYTPDILHMDTSPVWLRNHRGKTTFIQPLLTGHRITDGKHWMVMFVDLRGSDRWSVELYNSGDCKHKVYEELAAQIRDDTQMFNRACGEKALASVPPIDVNIYYSGQQKDKKSCGTYIAMYVWNRI